MQTDKNDLDADLRAAWAEIKRLRRQLVAAMRVSDQGTVQKLLPEIEKAECRFTELKAIRNN
jgi:hypothetical protein